MKNALKHFVSISLCWLLASLASATENPCRTTIRPKDDLSIRNLDMSDPDILDQMTLSTEDRVDLLCQLRKIIEQQYAPLLLKKERIQVDLLDVMNECVVRESGQTDRSRLKFLDRAQACIAQAQDTHFGLTAQVPPPPVFTAFELREIGGRFYIASRLTRLLDLMDARGDLSQARSLLAVGNEVVAIDDQSPAELATKMEAYISSSSPAFRRLRAVEALTRRNFAYPNRNYLDVKVRQGNSGQASTLRLPYWTNSQQNVPDAALILRQLNIPSTETIKWNYDNVQRKWVKIEIGETDGFDLSAPLIPEKQLDVYTDEAGLPAARMGQVIQSRERAYCYSQLLTFNTETLKSPSGEVAPYIKTIAGFLMSCQEKQLPLVLDLRTNGGGIAQYPEIIMSFLANGRQAFPPMAMALRLTHQTSWMLAQTSDYNRLPARNFDLLNDANSILDAVSQALRQHQAHTDVLVSPDIRPSLMAGGYREKIVALVSPYCISACDIMSALLKNSQRAVLMGEPSNGTGAGFLSLGRMNSEFSDPYGLIATQVPNFMFGFAKSVGQPSVIPYEQGKDLLNENRPILPDLPYNLTVTDLRTQSRGLLAKAVDQLFAPPGAPQPR